MWHFLVMRPNKEISLFQVMGLKILGRFWHTFFFLEFFFDFMHFERHFTFQNA